MKIAIHGKTFKEEHFIYVKQLLNALLKYQIQVIVFEPFLALLQKKNMATSYFVPYYNHEDLNGIDFVFSVGGDGTLLDAVTFIKDKEIPILGFNAGRLGFLATTPPKDFEKAVQEFFEGKYTLVSRSLIHLEADKDIFQGINFGLNEFTILKKDTSSMIVVHAYIDGTYLNSYWSDGLIISTPTGSTGYSLSCGGPLVMPTSNNFIISPISPHNLNVRPMVVPDTSELSFKIESRSKNVLVALDSRSKSIPHTMNLKVRKENFGVRLVQLNTYSFLETLRSKLNWGLDMRN
ncbi:MAG: NAD kinase [Cytophagales bacterium]|nr:MAG: NAD kinase [Cytophagales bacterium]